MLAAAVAHGQTAPGPLLPPLPLPRAQLPPPTFEVPVPGHGTDSTSVSTVGSASRPMVSPGGIPADATGASSEAEKRALLLSRVHERPWYGWQTLTVDAGAVGTLLLGELTRQPPVFLAAPLAIYFLGAPVVHVAHGGIWSALGDVGIRVGLPLACFGAARLVGSAYPASGFWTPQNQGLATLAGAAGATALDASVLAWQRTF